MRRTINRLLRTLMLMRTLTFKVGKNVTSLKVVVRRRLTKINHYWVVIVS